MTISTQLPQERSGEQSAADRLLGALRSGVPCAPVRDLIGADDVAAAYRVQKQLTAARLADGARIVGRKIGATSKAVQEQLGVDQPDFGVLFDDMLCADDSEVSLTGLLQPKVEAEVAFVLRADLAQGPLDIAQCRQAVNYAVAAMEIVDSRIEDWDIAFGDTVADNASGGRFVLGEVHRSLEEVEPVEVSMSMSIGDAVVSTGDGSACLGDPLNALCWLAEMAREHGDPLRAGQIVLSGALGPMCPVRSGDIATVDIRGLGSVTARFVP